MDKISKLRRAILDALEEYKSYFGQTSLDIQPHIVADEKNHHYQFLWLGWQDNSKIFSVPIHADIIDDKIWIQKDTTEAGFANLLVEKGIPKSEIVLAYFPPVHRKLTEFAVN